MIFGSLIPFASWPVANPSIHRWDGIPLPPGSIEVASLSKGLIWITIGCGTTIFHITSDGKAETSRVVFSSLKKPTKKHVFCFNFFEVKKFPLRPGTLLYKAVWVWNRSTENEDLKKSFKNYHLIWHQVHFCDNPWRGLGWLFYQKRPQLLKKSKHHWFGGSSQPNSWGRKSIEKQIASKTWCNAILLVWMTLGKFPYVSWMTPVLDTNSEIMSCEPQPEENLNKIPFHYTGSVDRDWHKKARILPTVEDSEKYPT